MQKLAISLLFSISLASPFAQARGEVACGALIGGPVVAAFGIAATVVSFGFQWGTYSCSKPTCTNTTTFADDAFCCYASQTNVSEPLRCIGFPVASPNCAQQPGFTLSYLCPDCTGQPRSAAVFQDASWVLPLKIVGPIAIATGIVALLSALFCNSELWDAPQVREWGGYNSRH